MKKHSGLRFLFLAFLFIGFTEAPAQSGKTTLSAAEFAQLLKETPAATIIDVRTPGEFSKGHLENAHNYNWNGSNFKLQIASIDKSKPVFVYCLSGGRSAAAVASMRSSGFSEVYELAGGIMQWRAANLPEITRSKGLPTGMTKQQFDALLHTDKLVLVDFYADWCAPCKKMKPYLDEIANDMADNVLVVRINADENPEICKELNVKALPVLQIYTNETLRWTNTGFIEKQEVVKQIHFKNADSTK